jgi:hypothetical protein
MIGEDTGGWTSPYRDPGDHYAYPGDRPGRPQGRLTEAELLEAYRNAARADLEALGPADGVPVAIHAELRELRALADAMARQLVDQRELLELLASMAGVELADQVRVQVVDDLTPCPECSWIASHADTCPEVGRRLDEIVGPDGGW